MKQLMMMAAITLLTIPNAFAANGTWTGTISDSMCGLSHAAMIAKHGGTMTDVQCTEACVKSGAQYVFTSGGKIYALANQDDKDLARHAGRTVRLTGDMQGNTITASQITTPATSSERRSGTPEAVGTAGAVGSAIDAVSEITGSADKASLVGRPATFTRITVERVAGARSFWAGDSRNQRVFVVVDAVDLAHAVQPALGLKEGDVVAIDGAIARVPGSLGQVKVTSWGRLDDKDATALSERDVYVYAKHVQVLAR